MRTLVIIFCIFNITCGCNHKKSELKLIDFYGNTGTVISGLSEIASSIEYVPLETIASGIKDLKVIGDNYYLTNYKSEEIECFDNKGRLINKLARQGIGLEEYESIRNFSVSSDGKFLAVYSRKKLKIFENSRDNFSYLQTIDLSDRADISNFSFIPGQNNLLLSYFNTGKEPILDELIDFRGNSLTKMANHYRYKTKLPGPPFTFIKSVHYIYDNVLHFKEAFDDAIYSIDNSKNFRPELVLASHGMHFTPEILAQPKSPHYLEDLFVIVSVSESKRYLISIIIQAKSPDFRIYDKFSDKYFRIKGQVKDDISNGIDFNPEYCFGEKLYQCIDAVTFKNKVSGDKFFNSNVINPNKKETLMNLADSLGKDKNQVLVIVTLRE
jgi:hypothetical protein